MENTSENGGTSTSAERAIRRAFLFAGMLEIPLTEQEALQRAMYMREDEPHATRAPFLSGIFPPARTELALQWHDHYRLSLRKWKRVLVVTRIIAAVPFVRGIFVCNTLAFDASRDESDIDLFIVTATGWVWFARAAILALLSIARLRPGQKQSLRDSICACFFASVSALDLSAVRIPDKEMIPDVYLHWWIATCYPVYDDGIYERFVHENAWTRTAMPFWEGRYPTAIRRVEIRGVGAYLKTACENILSFRHAAIEKFCRTFQERILPSPLRERAALGTTSVVCTSEMIKLHHPDRREEIRDRFIKLLNEYGDEE